ncbi:MAG: sigma-54-dependent Fis family transcriptional regulator [Methylibium sp.]|uniref:sigma-54-dependent transcriptional regulator n=1 Tax=Methylibium sp. TaxID=2067992 RepID=UPI001849AE99|nr:sigma-54 dependent transcriptional regulator [Methylibium sp.]MBA3595946.1 sigma-54-dependent Fis family transcriptional regulator [Methylibium sp.]
MSATNKICLVEDDELLGETLCERFRIEGLPADWFKTGREALLALERRRYALAICDLRLPDMSGAAIFEALDAAKRPPFVFMTGFGSIDEAVGLLKAGAVDFVTKPFDLDQLMARVHGFCAAAPAGRDEPLLGISPSMRKIEALTDRLAESVESVLISGESGVGKEVIAALLHRKGGKHRTGEWVAVNCAGIPEALIEAELFGYVRGAFTGAARAHRGLIEQANGGTLFLDEIGDMPLGMQSRLLRVLQERKVTRIGAESATPVDFRLVCATHRDLPAMVRAGLFREDLYYRINVITVAAPPLRERREDIVWLADRMLAELGSSNTRPSCRLTLEAQQALFTHGWPGNVRELNHVLRRALALGAGPVLQAADLFPAAPGSAAQSPAGRVGGSLNEHMETAERAFVIAVLREHKGLVTEAATRLGISRKTLWEKMRRYGIDRQDHRAEV